MTELDPAEAQLSFDSVFHLEFRNVAADIYRITGDRQTAYEITQEAFAKLYVKWNRISKYDRPGAWVRRVAVRMAVRNRARRIREAILTPFHRESVEHDTTEYIDLHTAIKQLPRMQRAAIVFHYYHDLSVNEVAELLGCRPNTAKVHLHNARASLRSVLSERDKDEF